MTRLKLSEVTPERLATLTEPVQIEDDGGQLVGYFEPQPKSSLSALAYSELTPEEWERRVKEGGKPLEEYLAELQS